MGETTNRKFPYPEPSQTPDVPRDIEALAKAVDTDMATLLPVGAIIAYGGTATPAGWLLCDGQAFNENTYPLLKTVLGATSTPNLVDRFVKGSATRPAEPNGGAKKISEAQLPSHTHSVTVNPADAYHGHGASASAAGDHTHGLPLNQRTGTFAAGSSASGSVYQSGGFNSSPAGGHGHTIYIDAANANHSHGASAGATGSGADYEPQFYALLYIIKAA